MRILIITDKEGSAIDRLVTPIVKFNPHLKITQIAIHPKKYTKQDLDKVRELAKQVDLIDFAYWKTALALLKEIPELKEKKKILGHFNEHSLEEADWSMFDRIYCCNEWQAKQLQKYDPKLLRLSIDTDLFTYQEYRGKDTKTIGYVGRVGNWKGINEIQKATKELGYKFLIIGNIASFPYWQEMDKSNVEFIPDLADAFMAEYYSRMTVYCCNSKDGTESGTMPLMEAMLCGTPLVTRMIGVVREIGEHMKNMYIREGAYDDIEDLKKALKTVVEDEELRLKFREKGRKEVRRRSYWKRARDFDKFYHQVLYPEHKSVSIIIPTFNRAEILVRNLEHIRELNYPNLEVVIIDDGSTDNTEEMVKEFREKTEIPIRYIKSGSSDKYGLAEARNRGAMEAIGEILVFLDDRLAIDEDAVTKFVSAIGDKEDIVVFGTKDYKNVKYIENFSAIPRKTFFKIGMFNHLIDVYGGMTEDYMRKLDIHNIAVKPTLEAKATPLAKSSSKWQKQDEIVKAKFIIDKIYEN